MIDLLERWLMYPPLDLRADARAEPAGSSLKLHLISVKDRMMHGLIRKLYWVDTRDMLVDGLIEGGID